MANVIDTLVVELALDPSKFTAAQRQAIVAAKQMETEMITAAKGIEGSAARMEHAFEAAKRQALGLLGAFFGGRGIKEFVQYITQADAELARTADHLQMSVTQLGAWENVARITGGTAEGMAHSMERLNDQIARAQVTGDWGNLLSIFNRFGISLTDAKGQIKDVGTLMGDLNRVFSTMDPQRARAILGMLGMDRDTVRILTMNRQALHEMMEEQRTLRATTQEDTEAALRLYTAWERLTLAAENFGKKVVTAFANLPGLMGTLNVLTTAFDKAARLYDAIARGTLPTRGRWGDLLSGTPQGQIGAPTPLTGGGPAAVDHSNMGNFLRGLSFLEIDMDPSKHPDQAQMGFFGFTQHEAKRAMGAGLGDPRVGDYSQQSAIVEKFIRMFYPAAAQAIDKGDFETASKLLNKEWLGLQGGSQPQGIQKNLGFENILSGGGPMPANVSTNTVTIGSITFNVSGADHPEKTAETINKHIRRVSQASAGAIGPH